MTYPIIRARVFTSRSHMYHQDPWGRVGDYPGHRCTTKCRRIWTWHYQVTVNGETLAADNTGSWRVIYDLALKTTTQARILAGQLYAGPDHPIRHI